MHCPYVGATTVAGNDLRFSEVIQVVGVRLAFEKHVLQGSE